MRRRSYSFTSRWRVRAPLHVCWSFLTSPGQRWLDWWQWLESIDVQRADGLVGSTAHCVWRSPVGYRMRMDLRLVDLVPGELVELAVDGDVAGRATVRFSSDADSHVGSDAGGVHGSDAGSGQSESAGCGTRIDVEWHVTTERAWMNVTGPLLRPVYTWGHRAVMRAGERGLNAVLADAAEPPW